MTTTKIATLGIALILFGTGAFATAGPSGPQPRAIAQETPEPTPTPTAATSDQNGVNATPAPTATGVDQAPAVNAGGQPSPLPATTPEPTMPVATAMPMTTPLPTTNGTTPVSAPAATDIRQGGTTGNSNGANWLDKFNRNPGPDTSGMQGVNTKYMHPGAPAKSKVKVKKHPPSGM
jgi:hypothetical protein